MCLKRLCVCVRVCVCACMHVCGCCICLQGAALGSMVGFMTYGNRKFYDLDTKMRGLIPPLYKAMKDLIPFVDADAAAFSEYMVSQ